MPKYHARGISVHLGTIPLDETSTPHVVLKKGEVAKRQFEEADKQLRGSRKLDEKCVPVPGDATDLELHWLGDVPFMQVQVENVCDAPETLQRSTAHENDHAASAPETASIPKALVLHVGLSNKTFVSGFDTKTHLKIDVLFNGQLSGCTLIHTNDVRSGAKSLDQVFAGSRVDYLAERPWVILPPGSTLDGKPRTMCIPVSAEDRWDQISQALVNEAVERGINRHSDIPSTAKLLMSLARTQMPEQLDYDQNPGSRTFGVVDVIITAGEGKKFTTGTRYLNQPERLRDACFSLATTNNVPGQSQSEDGKVYKRAAREPRKSHQGVDAAAGDVEADHSDHSDDEPPSKRRTPSSMLTSKDYPQLTSTCSSSIVDGVLSTPPQVQITSHTSFPWTTPGYSEQDGFSPLPEVCKSFDQPILPTHGQHSSRIQHQTRKSQSSGDGSFGAWPHFDPSRPCPALVHAPLANQNYTSHSDLTPKAFQSADYAFMEEPGGVGSFSSPMAQDLEPSHMPFPQMQLGDGPFPLETIGDLPMTDHFETPRSLTCRDGKYRSDSGGFTQPRFSSSTFGVPLHYNYTTPINSSPGTIDAPQSLPRFPIPPPAFYGTAGPSPYERRFTYPPLANNWDISRLPPTGFFTVPRKPRRAAYSSDSKLRKYRPGIDVSRLVVMGKNGVTIVDHHWTVPQHVPPFGTKEQQQETTPTIIGHANLPSGSGQSDYSTICPLSEEVLKRLFVPDASMDDGMRFEEGSQADLNRRHSAPALPYLRRHHGAPGEIPVKGEPTRASNDSSSLPAPEQRKVLPRFKINRTSSSGAQKSIATAEKPDDSKNSSQVATTLESDSLPTSSVNQELLTASVDDARGLVFCSASSSSPLSSAPPSPMPSALPQFDGPPDRRRATLSSTRPPTRPSPPLISDSPDPPDSKKRKAPSYVPVKKVRAAKLPDTMHNPPLNQNCAIAFAEGRDPSTKQGVLRQVRGERQGVFKEDYVVFAARFYVPGN